jgi:hypothetical protein
LFTCAHGGSPVKMDGLYETMIKPVALAIQRDSPYQTSIRTKWKTNSRDHPNQQRVLNKFLSAAGCLTLKRLVISTINWKTYPSTNYISYPHHPTPPRDWFGSHRRSAARAPGAPWRPGVTPTRCTGPSLRTPRPTCTWWSMEPVEKWMKKWIIAKNIQKP